MRRLALLAVTPLAFAGCGNDSGSSAGDPDPCARPAGFRAVGDELPRALLPGGTTIAGAHRKGTVLSGELFFPAGLNDAFSTLTSRASAAGYRVGRTDNEGFEAEIELTGAGQESLRFRLHEIQGCSSASRAQFARLHESG